MSTPYIGFSNETLAKCLDAHAGDVVSCPQCGNKHRLEPAADGSTLLLFYRCQEKSYLGALAGKLVVNMPADVSGEA